MVAVALASALVAAGALGAAAAYAAAVAPPERVIAVAASAPARAGTTTSTAAARRFAREVGAILNHPRGWSLGGAVRFRMVRPAEAELTIELSTPAQVSAASPACSAEWSCRVGDRVLINVARWDSGAAGFALPLGAYRRYLITHEVGHWLGLDHADCAGAGEPAAVMVQQSKGVDGCRPNPWPLADERRHVERWLNVRARKPRRLEAAAPVVQMCPNDPADMQRGPTG